MKVSRTANVLLIVFLTTQAFLAQQTGVPGHEPTRGFPSVRDAKNETIDHYDASYALLIGAYDYQQTGLSVLHGVEGDLTAVAGVLRDLGFTVDVLRNPRTAEALRMRLQDFVNSHDTGVTRIVVYYSGHCGPRTHKDFPGILIPSNGIPESLELGEVASMFANPKSWHVFVAVDCCYSGSIAEEVHGFRYGIQLPWDIQAKMSVPTRFFLTAGSASETVPDESKFRRAFVTGLTAPEGENADYNRDGYITGSELSTFVQERVIRQSQGKEKPWFGRMPYNKYDKTHIQDLSEDIGDMVFKFPKDN